MPSGLEGKSLRFKVQWRGQSGGHAASAARSRLDIMQLRGSDTATRAHFVSSGPARALLGGVRDTHQHGRSRVASGRVSHGRDARDELK